MAADLDSGRQYGGNYTLPRLLTVPVDFRSAHGSGSKMELCLGEVEIASRSECGC